MTDAALDQQRAIERQEHTANVVRLRGAFRVALALWPAFGLLDWAVVHFIHPAFGLGWFLGVRSVLVPIGAAVTWRLSSAPLPTPAFLRFADTLIFGLASASIAAMCVGYGGIASPYAASVSVILVARGAFVAQAWREALLPTMVTLLAFPAVLLASALFVPEVAAQLQDAAALTSFAQYVSFLAATCLFALIGGHTVWALRRQVFEARSIGRYRLVRRLGAGGMGEVWAAHHGGLQRDVALKILRPDATSQSSVQRFEREVKATTELTHPNTVRVFDYGVTDDGLWYYAMELLDGTDLADLVSREGPLLPERAVHLVWQAARALAEAHARGIVHRDVKPENVFVTAAGDEADFVKVLDFGIAKIEASDTHATLTMAGWVGGTPAYMSPEVAAGRPASARSDVYALGSVLYFLLAGRPPFEQSNVAALLYAQINEEPRPPSEKRGEALPSDVEALVMRCLAKAPANRDADGGELAAALARTTLAGKWRPVTSRPSRPTPSSPKSGDEMTLVPETEPSRARLGQD